MFSEYEKNKIYKLETLALRGATSGERGKAVGVLHLYLKNRGYSLIQLFPQLEIEYRRHLLAQIRDEFWRVSKIYAEDAEEDEDIPAQPQDPLDWEFQVYGSKSIGELEILLSKYRRMEHW